MNIRKPVDFSAIFTALDALMTADLPQMELYSEIGRLVSGRPEKGAAVAIAEYLGKVYPDAKGFSPRNLRRMREFWRVYEDTPKIMTEAMGIGWTQNVTILEGCESLEERVWYIRAVRRFGWTKAVLTEQIHAKAHLKISLDFTDEICYTGENATAKGASSHDSAQNTQRHGAGNAGSGNRLSPLLCMLHPRLLCGGIQPLLVRQRRGRSLGMADGAGPPGRCRLRQSLREESRAGQPGVIPGPRQLPAGRLRLRHPLRGRVGEPPGETNYGRASERRTHAVQGLKAHGWIRQGRADGLRYSDYEPPDVDLCHCPQFRICPR